jgi:hypothetical protein
VLALSLLAFGLGTPVAFAMSAAAIYHEAPLWGLATALFGVHFALGLARSRARPGPPVVGLAIAAGAALLARVTFALPLYALLGAFALALLSDALPGGAARIRATLARLVLWTSPALGLLAFQLWLNHDRFGAVTTFIDFRHLAYLAGDPRSWGILQQTGSFDLGRVPTALVNYFGVRPEALLGRFPFVAMTSPSYLAPDLYPSIFREKVASLSVVSTWLVAGALVGCASLLRRDASWLLRVVVVALFGQTLLVLAYYIVSHRYALDFLPFLWAGYACFVGGFGRRCGARAASGLLAVAVATSVLATLCAVISWIPQSRRFTPPSYKVHVLETIGDVSAFLAGSPEP